MTEYWIRFADGNVRTIEATRFDIDSGWICFYNEGGIPKIWFNSQFIIGVTRTDEICEEIEAGLKIVTPN